MSELAQFYSLAAN